MAGLMHGAAQAAQAARRRALRVIARIRRGRDRRCAREPSGRDDRIHGSLAVVAHELRNPLTPLCAALQLQKLAAGDPARVERARQVMERQVAHLVRLVDDLLDVSRCIQGKLVLRRERVPLTLALAAATDMVRPALEIAHIELHFQPPARGIWIHADPIRVTQVLGNLLGNAAKFTHPGGHIWLTAALEDPRGPVCIRVRDDGIGIRNEDLPHVFELFEQASDAADRTAGLGIGLALVRRLVELHGGAVEAHSEGPDTGTEFIVRLPVLLEGGDAMDRDRLPEHTVPATPRKVLVVDDDREVTAALSEVLEMLGHQTREAHDGPTALRAAEEFAPDVILLDLKLPGMDGCEVAQRLRAMPASAGAFIAALTGWSDPEDVARARQSGCDRVLTKPTGIEVLRETAAGHHVLL
jgi:CheY-like chemotaxis protein